MGEFNKVNDYIQNGGVGVENNTKTYKEAIDKITINIINEYWKWCIETIRPDIETKPELIYVKSDAFNSFNPFSNSHVKLEPAVYGDVKNTSKIIEKVNIVDINWLNSFKKDIIMDMNGSMAWFSLIAEKEEFCKKVQKCFVMGGIIDKSVVNTLSAVPGVLNRLSSATMNQLYHPLATEEFFQIIGGEKLVFITNNEINSNFSWSKPPRDSNGTQTFSPGYDVFKNSMKDRKLIPDNDDHTINNFFDAFYFSRPGDRKPFDVISALYLCHFNENNKCEYSKGDLHFNKTYGCTILTQGDSSSPSFDFIMNDAKNINIPVIGKGIEAEIDVYKAGLTFEKQLNINIASIKTCPVNLYYDKIPDPYDSEKDIPYTVDIFKNYLEYDKKGEIKLPIIVNNDNIVYDPPKMGTSGGGKRKNISKVGKLVKKTDKIVKTQIRKEAILGSVRSVYKITGKGNKLFVDIKGKQKSYTEIKKTEKSKN